MAAPLPQGYAHDGVTPVQVLNGFLTTLPGRSRLFFQRIFFASKPTPIQQAGVAPFPREIPIARIQAPRQQVIVIKRVEFQSYEHSGIGIEDIIQVPPTRVTTYIGYKFSLGNRGLTDYLTNVPAQGVPILISPIQGPTPPRAGQGNLYPFSGALTPSDGQNYAAYAMPGDDILASAVIFRPPNFDLRLFSVSISGWLAEETEFNKIINKLTSPL